MTTLYLIRHAEAEGNLYRRFHGQFNTNLTGTGLRQLEPLLRAEGAAFLLLNAVSRDARRLLDFYEERAGMTCWSARMIKKL